MTAVRQKPADGARRGTAKARTARKKAVPSARASSRSAGGTKVAQVRLQSDELAALHQAMRRLSLPSTSEALREGLRLLVREAAEVEAAEEIRAFYDGAPAPLPDGVVPPTDEELRAADEARW